MRWFLLLVVFVVACDQATQPCRDAAQAPTLIVHRFGPAYPGGHCADSIQTWLDECADTTWTVPFDECSQYTSS